MSKQKKTTNNKGPANRRPASSKGKANGNETGRRPKTSNTRSAAASRSSRGESSERSSSRSSFDKKPGAKRSFTKSEGGGSGEFRGKSEGRGYAAKKPSRAYGDSERSGAGSRGAAKKPSRAYGENERSGSGPRGAAKKTAAKRSFSKRDDNSLEYKSRAGEGRSSAGTKKTGRAFDSNERSGTGSRGAAKKPAAKRSYTKRDGDSADFNKSADRPKRPSSRSSFAPKYVDKNEDSFPHRLSSFPDNADAKPSKKRSAKRDDDNEDEGDNDYFLEGDASEKDSKFDKSTLRKGRKSYENKMDKLSKNKPNPVSLTVPKPFETRLNKYISNSGVCSRREADQLITEGLVKVNGVVVTELGHKVQVGDSVKYNNKVLNPEKSVYVLLNKPKDFITTMEDENNRKTVMQLIANATKERIYPVGRLDRNTTGLLLFTNDGELAQKLTHPSNKIKKIYEVELDKAITAEDFDKIADGKIHLFDGPVKVDEVAIISPNKKVLGIEIHEGRNRIVRRIFESLGYEVQKLDRVMYSGLTKKNIPRGSWRYLTATEINKIKYLD